VAGTMGEAWSGQPDCKACPRFDGDATGGADQPLEFAEGCELGVFAPASW